MTIQEIRSANAAGDHHFFDLDTMRFFRSRILPTVYQGKGGIFFVTSEQPPQGKRAYSVRQFRPATGSVETVGPHCQMTKGEAVCLARRAADLGAARTVNFRASGAAQRPTKNATKESRRKA